MEPATVFYSLWFPGSCCFALSPLPVAAWPDRIQKLNSVRWRPCLSVSLFDQKSAVENLDFDLTGRCLSINDDSWNHDVRSEFCSSIVHLRSRNYVLVMHALRSCLIKIFRCRKRGVKWNSHLHDSYVLRWLQVHPRTICARQAGLKTAKLAFAIGKTRGGKERRDAWLLHCWQPRLIPPFQDSNHQFADTSLYRSSYCLVLNSQRPILRVRWCRYVGFSRILFWFVSAIDTLGTSKCLVQFAIHPPWYLAYLLLRLRTGCTKPFISGDRYPRYPGIFTTWVGGTLRTLSLS